MAKAKFFELITKKGNVTININNIATIEEDKVHGTRITLDVTNEEGDYITYNCSQNWSSLASEITRLSLT